MTYTDKHLLIAEFHRCGRARLAAQAQAAPAIPTKPAPAPAPIPVATVPEFATDELPGIQAALDARAVLFGREGTATAARSVTGAAGGPVANDAAMILSRKHTNQGMRSTRIRQFLNPEFSI